MTRGLGRATTAVAWCALAGVGGASGCANPNDEISIGDRVYIEALTPDHAAKPFGQLTDTGDAPSLKADSLDRDHWSVRAVLVPINGTTHQPTYATGPSYARATARQRGEFPTIESALDLGTRESQWSEVFEGLAWPFWAGADLALMPARMVMQPPWDDAMSPPGPRDRAPEGTQKPSMLGSVDSPVVPVVGAKPSVPPVEEPRWIWRDGKWYLWTPGDTEPWLMTPVPTEPAPMDAPTATTQPPATPPPARPVQPEPSSDTTKPATVAVPVAPAAPMAKSSEAPKPSAGTPAESRPRGSGGWIFKDGKWVKTKPEDAKSAEPTPEPKP